ncbi:hypothetical protein DITRI_Ditri04bG0158100 [Diplodiscus trichospermus]
MVGFSVSDKAAEESSSIEAVDFGVQLQSSKLLVPGKMMFERDNHHRRFSPYAIGYGDVDADGPTGNKNRPQTPNIYDVFASSDYSSGATASAVTVASGGAVGIRTLQPFDISPSTASAALTAFKSPEAMAASLEFPFTSAQWKELGRQAMIYKYMKASVPVPLDLLIPITGNISVPVASHSALGAGALNLRFSSRGDIEPGRCRRTDGKKWRCSRDVAPDQKYCERHMHRGRPRSRKPVELPNKKTRHTHTQALPSSSSNIILTKNASPSPFVGTLAQPFQQNQTTCFLDEPNEKAVTFWPVISASSYKEHRNAEWIVNEDLIPMASSDQQWQHLTQIGTTSASSFSNADNYFAPNHNYNKEPLNLNSYANSSATEDQHRTSCPSFLNSEIVPLEKSPEGTPRGFIDAWSTGVSGVPNANSESETSASCHGKLSLSSLSLSMGVNNIRDDEIGPIQMRLGVSESNQNHEYAIYASKSHLSSWIAPASLAASTPGGPLAEVLRPSKTTATAEEATESSSNPSSPITGHGNSCSTPVTVVSSSGVLLRTLASFSDSSGSSSPTLASSGAKPEIGLMWLTGKEISTPSSWK